jgi:hypothetical protein
LLQYYGQELWTPLKYQIQEPWVWLQCQTLESWGRRIYAPATPRQIGSGAPSFLGLEVDVKLKLLVVVIVAVEVIIIAATTIIIIGFTLQIKSMFFL